MKLLLLLAVGLDLAWTQQDQSKVPVQPGFTPDQVTGSWKTLNLASTNHSVIDEGGAQRCILSGIASLNNGNLNITYFHRINGKCVKGFVVAEKTGTPGRYTFDYQGKNYLTFVAVTKQYIVLDVENQNQGNTLIVVGLHGTLGLVPYLQQTSRRRIGLGNTENVALDVHSKM